MDNTVADFCVFLIYKNLPVFSSSNFTEKCKSVKSFLPLNQAQEPFTHCQLVHVCIITLVELPNGDSGPEVYDSTHLCAQPLPIRRVSASDKYIRQVS